MHNVSRRRSDPLSLPVVLVPHPHVRVNPQILGGSPHVSGSRVPVRRLWAFHQRGTSVEVLIKRFPQLTPAQIFDSLAFAYDNLEVIEADLAHETEMLKRTGQKLPSRPSAPEQIELPFAKAELRARRGGNRRGRRA